MEQGPRTTTLQQFGVRAASWASSRRPFFLTASHTIQPHDPNPTHHKKAKPGNTRNMSPRGNTRRTGRCEKMRGNTTGVPCFFVFLVFLASLRGALKKRRRPADPRRGSHGETNPDLPPRRDQPTDQRTIPRENPGAVASCFSFSQHAFQAPSPRNQQQKTTKNDQKQPPQRPRARFHRPMGGSSDAHAA